MDSAAVIDTESANEQIRAALLKQPVNRSYDDLLLLKSWLGKTEFMVKNLDGIVNPQQVLAMTLSHHL